ncbi:MAG: OadG family protein [Bacteroidales bacterium]|jgi:Na+-transporting methylmalonyl-CoA/oxaloacetate decarboxylase gamma subunit|nr:OadG family protein [Bacteroidales bacterium]
MRKRIFNLAMLCCFVLPCVLSAQEQTSTMQAASYDPLIPQMFAVDSETQTIAVINKNENKIEILNRTADGYKKAHILLADQMEGRHDVYAIYRPQSIAIYENHIVYLASNRDSSFVRILTLDGVLKQEHRFGGAANAFSYDVKAKMLYLAGDNATGYNIFAIDVKDGFEHINVANSPSFQYVKPRKADEIQKHDPFGAGLAMIAMGTVFIVLIVITLVMMGFSGSLKAIRERKSANKSPIHTDKPTNTNVSDNGEELAAIAAALYMYNEELHDEEATILTINKVAKVYSPWSSKMYNMNNYKR